MIRQGATSNRRSKSEENSKQWKQQLTKFISKREWDSALALLDSNPEDSTSDNYLDLPLLISEMKDSPLFLIFQQETKHFVLASCPSCKTLYRRLLDIGGAKMARSIALLTLNKYNEKVLWTALHYACFRLGKVKSNEEKQFWLEVIEKLLEIGGEDLVLVQGDLGTSLHVLLTQENFCDEIVMAIRLLLKVGGEKLALAQDSQAGRTALHYACLRGDEFCPRIVQDLLESGGNKVLYTTAEDGITALHCCAASDMNKYTISIVDLLLKAGGKRLALMSTDGVGYTLLHTLCSRIEKNEQKRSVQADVIRRLVDIGGEELVLMHDTGLMTALHHFCTYYSTHKRINHCPNILNTLLQIGGEKLVSKVDGNGDTALHIACYARYHQKELIYQLLDVGRDISLFMEQLDEPFLNAAEIIVFARNGSMKETIDRILEVGGGRVAPLL